MGLFEGLADPEQFESGGGLLGRLLALHQFQGQFQPSVGFDQASDSAPATLPAWPTSGGSAVPYLSSQNQPFQPTPDGHQGNLLPADYAAPAVADVPSDMAQPESMGQTAADRSITPPSICRLRNEQIVSYQDLGDGYGAIDANGNAGLGIGIGRAASDTAMPTASKTGGLAGGGKSGNVTSSASRIIRDFTAGSRYKPLRAITGTASVGGSIAKALPFWGALLGFIDFVNMQNAEECSPTT
jgi:hypothetical protein